MTNQHITHILDNAPLNSLSESELSSIRAHVANCTDCARAFDAARLSDLLLKERADEAASGALNANPFFETRVLAAWRQQQEQSWSWSRLWKAAGALVSSMAATTALLAAVTFIVPAEETTPTQTAALMPSSVEAVMLEDEEELTNDRALSAIYDEETEAK